MPLFLQGQEKMSDAMPPEAPARAAILVVEDEWLLATGLAEALTANGYTVAGPVPSVDAALQVMAHQRVAAALLDVNLGGHDRVFDLARMLSAQHIPFAFVTAYSRRLMPPDLRGQPMLQKPVEAEHVMKALAELLGR